jgi:hypothetical protein
VGVDLAACDIIVACRQQVKGCTGPSGTHRPLLRILVGLDQMLHHGSWHKAVRMHRCRMYRTIQGGCWCCALARALPAITGVSMHLRLRLCAAWARAAIALLTQLCRYGQVPIMISYDTCILLRPVYCPSFCVCGALGPHTWAPPVCPSVVVGPAVALQVDVRGSCWAAHQARQTSCAAQCAVCIVHCAALAQRHQAANYEWTCAFPHTKSHSGLGTWDACQHWHGYKLWCETVALRRECAGRGRV